MDETFTSTDHKTKEEIRVWKLKSPEGSRSTLRGVVTRELDTQERTWDGEIVESEDRWMSVMVHLKTSVSSLDGKLESLKRSG